MGETNQSGPHPMPAAKKIRQGRIVEPSPHTQPVPGTVKRHQWQEKPVEFNGFELVSGLDLRLWDSEPVRCKPAGGVENPEP